jgi:RNA polymerase sigma-70 factor, ECF subfamily
MGDDTDQSIRYMQQVIAWQPRLYAFILSLTGDPNEGDDVLQNANVALLQKQKAFRPDAKFGAWAMQIAYHEVQRHWDSTARARRRFDDRLVDQLAAKMAAFGGEPGPELVFLRQCMSRLSAQEREMLGLRYGGNSVQAIAERCGRPAGSISQTLYRIRSKLAECVKKALRAERRDEP